MALTVTAAGTVIGKNNIATGTSNFTVNIAAIKSTSSVFATRIDSSTGGQNGPVSSYGINANVSFVMSLGLGTASTTESVAWEVIL